MFQLCRSEFLWTVYRSILSYNRLLGSIVAVFTYSLSDFGKCEPSIRTIWSRRRADVWVWRVSGARLHVDWQWWSGRLHWENHHSQQRFVYSQLYSNWHREECLLGLYCSAQQEYVVTELSTCQSPISYKVKASWCIQTHRRTHTHTRLTALCPGLPGWAGTRKVKPMWISLKQETVGGIGISWAICKSAPRSRQITMPAPHHSVFYRPDALPAAQLTASRHWRPNTQTPATLIILRPAARRKLRNVLLNVGALS